MSAYILPEQALVREVTGPNRTGQISATPSADGRWEFSLIICDGDGQVMTDLTGVIAPDDVSLVLSVLPLEVATMGAWGGPPTAAAERRRKHPNLYQKWTPAEEADLLQQFQAGEAYAEIARSLGRTVGGVKARLVRLGHLTPQQAGWPMGSQRATADA
ncbi:MAG: hypothetical protein HOU81_18145 [Hamadaea sp.]|uniref:hypothetical protein n=1 Tax=Hamadaea sp. TaxID=2024425 RepID=UPI001814F86E|nr:hypothetical protein [Hamadaea sp.]NUR72738.1 hypothetical protein [Hamadaea sp.]NUT18428.1 hypothetical protein [Hamadaea sp.]